MPARPSAGPGSGSRPSASARSGEQGRTITAQVCVVGGGPAGMMLGYLLARAGVQTLVLEKHADFLRDFRGDTVHPSTMQVLAELGLLETFLTRPHNKVDHLSGHFGRDTVNIADFRGLNITAPFIAFMPQWEFLDFLFGAGAHYPNLKVLRKTEAIDLIRDGETITGVVARDEAGRLDVKAALTVGCDGRHSVVRECAGLAVDDVGAPIDVLWFRVGRNAADADSALMNAQPGRIVVTIDRGDYWQCAYVIPKGEIETIKARGLERFRNDVVATAPRLAAHIDDLKSWDDVKLLTVTIDRLKQWAMPGLLCIGDAAHAMSPVGGVGINLAIQDAVAAANLLADKFGQGCPDLQTLDLVQQRRMFPVKVTQALQIQMQDRIIGRALRGGPLKAPAFLKVVSAFPFLQRVIARVLGVGVRPEHVRSRAGAIH